MIRFLPRNGSPWVPLLSAYLLAAVCQASAAGDTPPATAFAADALKAAPRSQSPLELALLAAAGALVLVVVIFGMRHILRDQAARDGLGHKKRADYLDSRSHLNTRDLPSNHRHL